MSLLQRIKDDRMGARIHRETIKARLLTTLVGEAETALKGKQAAKFDMLALVKKFYLNQEDSLKVKYTDEGHTELCILNEYLPEMIGEDELSDFLDYYIENGETKIGVLMGKIKSNFDNGTVDMGMASGLVKARIALAESIGE